MNICLFISSLYDGGSERVTCNLANYLCSTNNKVTIVTFGANEKSYELRKDVLVCNLISTEEKGKFSKFIAILIRIFRLYRLWKNNQYDVVISMLPVQIILALCMKSIIRGKIIISERVYPQEYCMIFRYMLKNLVARADGCVFQTDDIMRWYKQNSAKCVVIPNAVNKDFCTKQYSGKREKKIVSVGRLEKQKNFELLIKAFALLPAEFDEYTLHIFGEGNEREKLTRLIQDLKLESKVFLEGNVKNVAERIYKATLFVLASDYEGMPNALMEAMSCGLPCISTDCLGGGARALIKSGENGYLVNCNDITELSECMKAVLSSEDIRLKLGSNAAKINEQNSYEKIYSKWESFIKRVCGVNA